jgi:hypothetical protein
MRERLFDLIAAEIPDDIPVDRLPDVDAIVDRLLAAGIIVPPCKVGDTVWHIRRTPEHMGGSYIVEAKVVCIPIRVYADEVSSDIIIRYTQRNGMPEEASSKLGKYAFFTKEEAEKALSERRANDEQAY